MYEPSRHLATFHLAGFQHWDGALVLDRLKPGIELGLAPEPDNPHDPDAVAVRLDGTKIGYLPADESPLVALMSRFGHADAFELRALQVDPEAAPWRQVRAGLFVRDAR